MPGIVPLPIAGGCLSCCSWTSRHIRGSAEEKSFVAATPAMWPAVLPGGRPVGLGLSFALATGKDSLVTFASLGYPRSTLVLCRSVAEANNLIKRPATGRWRTYMWSGPDGPQPGRGGRGGQLRGPLANYDRYGGAYLAWFFLTGKRRLPSYFPVKIFGSNKFGSC